MLDKNKAEKAEKQKIARTKKSIKKLQAKLEEKTAPILAQEEIVQPEPSYKKIGTNTIQFELSERQQDAMDATEQFIMYGGAKGGGKSWWLCLWVLKEALTYKFNKIFFCRRRSVDFTNTTLETWKKVIPSHLYRINEQKKKIFILPTNSVVDYGGLDDPLLIQSLNSAEYGAIAVDQAEEIEKDSFAMLRGTLRHKLPQGKEPSYLVRLTANPAQCWLKDEFILNPKPNFRFIPALPSDNPYLPSGYVQNLAEAFAHRPTLLQAYLHGNWDDLSGHDICIQGSWIEKAKAVVPRDTVLKRIIVNDPARFGDDENVVMVMEETPNAMYEVDRIILEHKSLMDTAGRLAALRKKTGATLIGVDVIGIGSGIVDALNDLGEPVLSINSSNKPTRETPAKKYFNLRSQMWMEAGELFSMGKVAITNNDPTMTGQLGSVRFDYKNGKMQVQSKDDIKKALGRSPDRADAFIMGLYTLSQSQRLDEKQYQDAITDRSSQGELVTLETESYGIGGFEGYGQV